MKRRVLALVALLLAVYLSSSLVNLGLDKFQYVLAGGRKFATFPNFSTQVGIGGSYLALSGMYLFWLWKSATAPYRFIDCLKKASIFLILALIAYPLGDDIYLYLHAGLMNLSHVNPFLVRAASFTSELSAFVDWGQTSTYGPVSQALFTLSAALVPLSPILAIYLFKTICLGLHIFNGYAIWRLLSLPERGKIALAYLIHPLLLMEQVGSGHVDVLVSTSLILFAGCLLRQRYSFSFAALWAGFLAKTIPLIWMPLLLIALVRRRRWWVLSKIGLLSLGLVVVLSLTVLPGGAWHSLLNPGVSGQYQSSLHSLIKMGLDVVRILLPSALTLAQEKQILLQVSSFTLLGFALIYSWIAFRIYRQPGSMLQLLETMGWATLILLLLATPWLMPWYASVLLTFAALLPRARLFCYTSLAFGLSSSAQYLLQGHNSLKAAVMIGLPALVLLTGMQLLQKQQAPDPANVTSPLLQTPQRRIVQ